MQSGSGKRVFLGISLGVLGGVLARNLLDAETVRTVVETVTTPVGQVFLRLLFLLAVPVVFSALVVGVADLDPKSLGRIGFRTLAFTALASTIAVVIGLTLVHVVGPGRGAEDLRELSRTLSAGTVLPTPPEASGTSLLVQMIPDNPVKAAATGDMLGLIVFSLLFGFALGQVHTEGAKRLREAVTGLFDVSMFLLENVLRLAPLGIGALLFTTSATLGVGVFQKIGSYVAVVVGALALHLFGTFSLFLVGFARRNPIEFFRAIRLPLETAFATASSSAALPVSLETADKELELPAPVARFVLTAGASMNQNGTALFEGVTVLFLAQLFGVELSLASQAMVLFVCILGGIGTAGIPGASLPVIAMILAKVGVPPEGLALVFGVDRFLDMCRTTLNVAGDLVIATCVAAGEPNEKKAPPEETPSSS